VLGRVEAQEARAVAMDQRAGGDHLGIEPRAPRDLPQEVAVVAVGPVHHRRDAQPVR
jgi:hypothetical protein